jgi:hypothetical protein
MGLNHHFWQRYFRTEFQSELSALVAVLEDRILPGFVGLEEEAERVSSDAWEAFMAMPGTGDEDPSDFADQAEQAGVSHYILLTGIRQGILNSFAATIFHCFEQQVMLFHRRELLAPNEENNEKLFSLREFINRLKRVSIDVSSFSVWPRIVELQLAANTVKHADGKSARELRAVRPQLFENPALAKYLGESFRSSPSVYRPLLGEDIYMSTTHIHEYADSCKAFWDELGNSMAQI